MGYSSWSNDCYTDREEVRARTGKSAFAYHADVSAGRTERKVHARMDPKGVVRESRDSDTHPDSVAIGVILDVTGSMHSTPVTMQKSLPKLMDAVKAAGIAHPHILFGAVGDHRSDKVPLQVGQFEAGIEMDDDLGRMYMEGGGGGSYEESYDLAMYFFAHHTSIDCHEKRGRKGYLFIIGDEHPYARTPKDAIREVCGDTPQDDVLLEDTLKALRDKYEVFFVIPNMTSHFSDPDLRNGWVSRLGVDHVIMLDDPSNICGAIASAIKGQPVAASATPRTVRL